MKGGRTIMSPSSKAELHGFGNTEAIPSTHLSTHILTGARVEPEILHF